MLFRSQNIRKQTRLLRGVKLVRQNVKESYAKPRKIFAVKNVCNLQETRYSKEGRDTLASPINPTHWLKQFTNILPLAILSYGTFSQTHNFELTSYRTYFVDSNISTFRPSSPVVSIQILQHPQSTIIVILSNFLMKL